MTLHLSLGHNSSAVYVGNGKTRVIGTVGYEQERLDRMKSSSKAPLDAINEIIKDVGYGAINDDIFATHWFDDLSGRVSTSKYFNPLINQIALLTGGKEIRSHTEDFTHHDAHAYAADNFLHSHYTMRRSDDPEPFIFIVADGFGNNQEVVSVYEKTDWPDRPKLVSRRYGYVNSLGLMYQFATSFTGMAENKDEYKFLGYESHISEFLGQQSIDELTMMAHTMAESIAIRPNEQKLAGANELINYTQLDLARKMWEEVFSDVLLRFSARASTPSSSFCSRVIIGFYIQQVLEHYFVTLVEAYNATNLCVSGGIFYNVKLNNALLNNISGKLCVYPAAGDQGAALGFGDDSRIEIDNLLYGRRKFYDIHKHLGPNAYYFTSVDDAKPVIARIIADGDIANVVTNRMEYGPRALGHTSSLFLPTAAKVAFNNHINDRNEVMPCAPIMRDEKAETFFHDTEYCRVIGSDRYMVVTYQYRSSVETDHYAGVMHRIPNTDNYSGRPQFINGSHYLYDVLERVEELTGIEALVNTSFNYHGQPIVFDEHSILQNYQASAARAEGRSKLVIINDPNL